MKRICVVFVALFLVAGCKTNKNQVKYPFIQEYVAGTGNIKGHVDIDKFIKEDEHFTIGANENGYAVFKDPELAFETLLKKYDKGINLIKEEFDLEDLSEETYFLYLQYGVQVSGEGEAKRQAQFVSSFLDIYENSFIK